MRSIVGDKVTQNFRDKFLFLLFVSVITSSPRRKIDAFLFIIPLLESALDFVA